jgi:hypothetical protein
VARRCRCRFCVGEGRRGRPRPCWSSKLGPHVRPTVPGGKFNDDQVWQWSVAPIFRGFRERHPEAPRFYQPREGSRAKPTHDTGVIARVSKFSDNPLGKTVALRLTPQPYMGVEQQLHERRTSRSSSSLAGETMSPTIQALPGEGSDPIRRPWWKGRRNDPGDGLTETGHEHGLPVLRTFSSTARQVALNFEMAISSMESFQKCTILKDHSPRKWTRGLHTS